MDEKDRRSAMAEYFGEAETVSPREVTTGGPEPDTETFSEPEMRVIVAMVEELQRIHREDTLGVVLKLTGHEFLDDSGVVEFKRKLEGWGARKSHG